MKKPLFKQITIIGVGLLGASLCMAVRKKGLARRIIGIYRTAQSRRRAQRLGLHHASFVGLDPQTLRNSDAVILTVPVQTMENYFKRLKPYLKPGTVVMDVGSTKRRILQAARALPPGVTFVGCHPMAGSEKKGATYAQPDLFDQALCFILQNAPSKTRRKCARFWKSLGCRVVGISPDRHDRIVAKISHLPHLAVSALLLSMCSKHPSDMRYGAGGLRDTLRIAGANPRVWQGIFSSNREYLRRELKRLVRELMRFDRALQKKDPVRIQNLLTKAARLKEKIT